uniref:Protein deadlock n=1 Tax=Bactrocera latifrons TaxID=174628 RepID=A0A0K8VG17_BACLA
MAEIVELERLEDQLYQYHPELRLDSEELKLERRNRLFMQLQSSQPEVQLVALDAVSSLTNIKSMLEKCKDVVLDYSHIISPPAMSSIESSGDEFLGTQRIRHTATRKRRTTSIQYSGSEVSKSHCGRKDESPLSLSILIPQVVKGSEKMEISIDLGELDASQRLFASRVDQLLRKRSNSSHQIEDAPSKENLNSNKCKDFHLQVATSSTIETVNENTEKPEDEMLSRLISQVLVENQETETLQATNLLDNINNNERSNYSRDVPDPVESSKEQLVKKKRQRKSKKSAQVEKGPPKKRGRKPKIKPEKQYSLENAEMAKSDLAKYVELFSNTCNMAGSVTPAASSTISQQLVTSTTHYLDSSDQQPITYYLEGNWENGGNCQLLQTDNTHIDGGQEEFNMAELVNYIDNVGDAGNAIARVLDAPANLPVLVQDLQSQSNAVVPPPAHVSDVLLDLSKKSTISYSQTAPPINNVPIETDNQDLMPLDLSLKSSKLIQKSVHHNNNLTSVETNFNNNCAGKLNETTEGVFGEHDYVSFRAALDMPLIDLEDNINAFMQLTNNETITTAPVAENTSTDCALLTKETANNPLPICNFEIGEILSETTLCNNNYNHNSQYNSKTNDLNSNVVKNGENALEQRKANDITKNIEQLKNKTANADEHTKTVEVGVYEGLTQRNCDTTCSQDSDRGQWLEELSVAKENSASNTETKLANVTENSENKAEYSSIVGGIDHTDELHGDSGDFLFVDTETLVANKSKSSFDGLVSATQLDTPREYFAANEVSQTTNANKQDTASNEDDACDLSTKADQSIDLEEDNQGHNVSVHLEIPQLPQLESNSEEFTYDYETALESIEDKDTAVNTVAESTQQPIGTQQYTEEHNANESQKSDSLSCNDSGIGNSVVGNVYESAEAVAKSTLTLLNNNNDSTVSNFITEEAPTKSTGNVDTNMNIESVEGKEQTDECTEEDGLCLKNFASCCKQEEAKTAQAQITEIGNEMQNCGEKDAGISCKPESVNAYSALETETQDLKQRNRKGNESFSQPAEVSLECPQDGCNEKIETASTHHNALEADQKQAIEIVLDDVKAKQPDTNRNLSVLEMELKMDDDCLDFEDEMEDDALSLATSCFNSSDDERCPGMDCAPVADFKPINTNENHENMQVVDTENEEMEDDKSTVIKVEVSKCPTHVSSDILKKFKIPKISMTNATAKHVGPAEGVITAGALPMVIVPTNAFNKQLIITERDSIKPVNLEKITRTVQNVCAVTPLTQQQSSYQPQTSDSTKISFDTIKPLMSDILQLPSSSNEAVMKNLKTVNDHTQMSCVNGDFAGNRGDGWNCSLHAIAIARTFGVTCLSFLVDRCFKFGNCEFSHTFCESETVGNILLTFSEVNLNIAYRFAYNHESLFRRYMHEFCRVYSARNNRIKLLHMARDCVRYHDGNKLLMTIFHSLEYCGLNKMDACRQILIYSHDRSQATIDVLLEIIFEADWTMFCDQIEKFIDITAYKFRVKVLHQMAPTILQANDQRMTSLFFKCLMNLNSNDVGLVQTSPILMQLLELIKNGQICR